MLLGSYTAERTTVYSIIIWCLGASEFIFMRALEKEYEEPTGPFTRKLLFFRIHIHCTAAEAIHNLILNKSVKYIKKIIVNSW